MSDRDPKRLILDAALATFVDMGFERATIAHICGRAGLSNGALFHHFPTKDAIAEALYVRGIASYQDGLIQALDQHRGVNAARATVKAAVHHHLAWVEANRELAHFIYERGRPDWQPAHGAAVRKLNRSAAVHVRDWLAPLATAGVLRDLPLPVLAACVVGPAHFISRRWLSGMITARPTSFAEALADAAWAALAPGKARRTPAQAHSVSPAAVIEATALDAACGACPATTRDDWTIAHMTTSAVAPDPLVAPIAAEAECVRVEGQGHTVLVEVVLAGTNGAAVMRGHVVCLRRVPSCKGDHTDAATRYPRSHC
jgi:AcrR family transcriptional regulator